MKDYTVAMLYPDYLSNQYGEEYYFAWVSAPDAKAAAAVARDHAAINLGEWLNDKSDFFVVAVYRGHLDCEYTEARNA